MHNLTLLTTPNLISYDEYTAIVNKLVNEGKTSGPMQTESLIKYTHLNQKRMHRLDKTSAPSPELQDVVNAIRFEMIWVVITEAWCGDAAQNLPFIAKLARLCPNVSLGLVLRDDNIPFMDNYLTNGSRSIPKLIVFRKSDMAEISIWGPRPKVVQDIVMEYKKQKGEKLPFDEIAEQIHVCYTKNKNQALQEELLKLFSEIKAD